LLKYLVVILAGDVEEKASPFVGSLRNDAGAAELVPADYFLIG
jgi:hypothetical protein